MTAEELLDQLNQVGEHHRIEAKRASEIGSSVMESVCAFSNEPGLGGGWLLLGVEAEKGVLFPGFEEYEVVGLRDAEKLSADLSSRCATDFDQPIRPRIETVILHGKTVLSVFVPELSPASKPLFLKKFGLPKGAFRRIGSADQHCTDDDLLVFYQDRKGETFDSGAVSDADMSHLDPSAILEYRAIRREIKPDAEELRWTDEELLEALGCVRRNNGISRPTVAGILLFGTVVALRRFFPMIRVDYIRVPGKEWVKDPDRRFDTVEIRAPLIRAIRRIYSAVVDDLPRAFSLSPGELERKEIPIVPDRVIREAIVNAVAHRSYRVNGPIQIIRYSNRLEIRNPGHSLKADDRLGEPGSENRNPSIAAVLHETNLAETKGSGIRVMRELMTQNGLTPPTFESDRSGNQFVVTMLFHHFLTPEDLNWLRGFSDYGLSTEDAKSLIFVREAGAINNQAYRDLNQVDVLTASKHLRRLRDQGLLEMKGQAASAYYVPTATLINEWTVSQRPESGMAEAQSGMAEAQSGMAEAQSGMVQPAIPPELSAQISQLKQRVPPHTVQDLVAAMCRYGSWSVEEIAKRLERTPQYVLDHYVRPLVKSGRLRMTHPDQPKHPHQRYLAAAPGHDDAKSGQ